MKDIVDYKTNRFIFKKWLDVNCNDCNYNLAKIIDSKNITQKITYCYNCEKNYNEID